MSEHHKNKLRTWYTTIACDILFDLPFFSFSPGYSFLVIPLLVFLVLLTNKLDGSIRVSYFSACSPLFLTFFTLTITSFGSRGGDLATDNYIISFLNAYFVTYVHSGHLPQETNTGSVFASRRSSSSSGCARACSSSATSRTAFTRITTTRARKGPTCPRRPRRPGSPRPTRSARLCST